MFILRSAVPHVRGKSYHYKGPGHWEDTTSYGNGLWHCYDLGIPDDLADLKRGLVHACRHGAVVIPGAPVEAVRNGDLIKRDSNTLRPAYHRWVCVDADSLTVTLPRETLEESRAFLESSDADVCSWVRQEILPKLNLPREFAGAGFIFHPSSKCWLLTSEIRAHIYFFLNREVRSDLWGRNLKGARVDDIYGPQKGVWAGPAALTCADQYNPWIALSGPSRYYLHPGPEVVVRESWCEIPPPPEPLPICDPSDANSVEFARTIFSAKFAWMIKSSAEGQAHNAAMSCAGKVKSAIRRGTLVPEIWEDFRAVCEERGIPAKEIENIVTYAQRA